LIIYCFTSRSRIFHLYGDVTIAGEGLQNLGLWLALNQSKHPTRVAKLGDHKFNHLIFLFIVNIGCKGLLKARK
jgi:hypothetical protein